VAEHTWGVALIALVLAEQIEEPVDRGRLLAIALLHDLAEAALGDLPGPARRYLPADMKTQAEAAVLQDALAGVSNAEDWSALWREYAERSSVEGRLVHDADRLEMMVQAAAYEQAGQRGLDEFWEGSDDATWEFPGSADLYRRLRARREAGGWLRGDDAPDRKRAGDEADDGI
jgi:putative hydrolase of HD superfamily